MRLRRIGPKDIFEIVSIYRSSCLALRIRHGLVRNRNKRCRPGQAYDAALLRKEMKVLTKVFLNWARDIDGIQAGHQKS
jgi:hypothetical protein